MTSAPPEPRLLVHTPAASDAFGARVRACEARAAGEATGHQIKMIRSDSLMSQRATVALRRHEEGGRGSPSGSITLLV